MLAGGHLTQPGCLILRHCGCLDQHELPVLHQSTEMQQSVCLLQAGWQLLGLQPFLLQLQRGLEHPRSERGQELAPALLPRRWGLAGPSQSAVAHGHLATFPQLAQRLQDLAGPQMVLECCLRGTLHSAAQAAGAGL